MKFNFLILFILVLIFSCFGNKNIISKSNQKDSNDVFKKLAFEKFQHDTVCYPSPQQNYILCIKYNKESELNPNALNAFFVFSNKSQKIIYENGIAGASLSWANDTLLAVSLQKGIIVSNTDSGKIQYFWDVKNNKKATFVAVNMHNK